MAMRPGRPPFGITLGASSAPLTRSIRVRGELDSGTWQMLVEAFEQTVGERSREELVLDLRDVSFVDSAGMRALIALEREADERGLRLKVVRPPEQLTEPLGVAGIAGPIGLALAAPGHAGSPGLTPRIELELRRDSLAPGRARAEIREALSGRLEEADLATVVLLGSEIVTNAVVHPRVPPDSSIALRIGTYRGGVRVEVEDPGHGFDPAQPGAGPTSGGGRGLFLVDRCAARWGAHRGRGGRGAVFRVWFEFEPDLGCSGSTG
jgi:serine/threonine-protein kinase RsbW